MQEFVRTLDYEESKLINIDELEFHEFIDEDFDMQAEDALTLFEDIHARGIQEPITLLDGKVLDGRKRWAVLVGEKLDFIIPYEEYIGPKDEETVNLWLRARNEIRTHFNTTMRAISAVEFWVPYFKKIKDAKKQNKIPLEETEKGETNVLAGRKTGIAAETVRKALTIKNKENKLYNLMKVGLFTLEDAGKIINYFKDRSDEWKNRVYTELEHNGFDFKKAIENLEARPLREDEYNGINLDNKNTTSMIKPSKTQKQTAIIPESRLIRLEIVVDTIGLKIIDDLKTKVPMYGGKIKVLKQQETKATISDEELENCTITTLEPDQSIEHKYQQYIGGRIKGF